MSNKLLRTGDTATKAKYGKVRKLAGRAIAVAASLTMLAASFPVGFAFAVEETGGETTGSLATDSRTAGSQVASIQEQGGQDSSQQTGVATASCGSEYDIGRLIEKALERNGASESDSASAQNNSSAKEVPEAWRSGMSSTGSARIIAFCVSFPDMQFDEGDTPEALEAIINGTSGSASSDGESGNAGAGTTADANSSAYPYESLHDYYERSSYGKLDISGDVFTYQAEYERDHYTDNPMELFHETLTALDDQIDYSKYDADGDGILDGVYIRFAGQDAGWNTTWWSVTRRYLGYDDVFDGKRPGSAVTLHEKSNGDRASRTLIHETGHVLGLPDYYSYTNQSTTTGLRTFDMMNDNTGDQCAFSKWLLGWVDESSIAKVVVKEDSTTVSKSGQTQTATGSLEQTVAALTSDDSDGSLSCGGFVAISNKDKLLDPDGMFSSYYLVQYDALVGNQTILDDEDNPITGGFRIYRVQADLDSSGYNFAKSNSGGTVTDQLITALDPLRSVSTDPTGWTGGYWKFFGKGDKVSPSTNPSTNFYESPEVGYTGISIEITKDSRGDGSAAGRTIAISHEERPGGEPGELQITEADDYPGAMPQGTIQLEMSYDAPLVYPSYTNWVNVEVDGKACAATLKKDGTRLGITLHAEPTWMTSSSTCTVAIPENTFVVAEDPQTGSTSSKEIKVPVKTASLAKIDVTGTYQSTACERWRTWGISDLLQAPDGGGVFFQELDGALRMVKISREDITQDELVVVEGTVLPTINDNGCDISAFDVGGGVAYVRLTARSSSEGGKGSPDTRTGSDWGYGDSSDSSNSGNISTSEYGINDTFGYWIDMTGGTLLAQTTLDTGFATSKVCPVAGYTCEQANVGGYMIVQSTEVKDGTAQACYWAQTAYGLYDLGNNMTAMAVHIDGGFKVVVFQTDELAATISDGSYSTYDDALEQYFDTEKGLLDDIEPVSTFYVNGYSGVAGIAKRGDGIWFMGWQDARLESTDASYYNPTGTHMLGAIDVNGNMTGSMKIDTCIPGSKSSLITGDNGALAICSVLEQNDQYPQETTVLVDSALTSVQYLNPVSMAKGNWIQGRWLAIGWDISDEATMLPSGYVSYYASAVLDNPDTPVDPRDDPNNPNVNGQSSQHGSGPTREKLAKTSDGNIALGMVAAAVLAGATACIAAAGRIRKRER